jgi:hypothetical protein
MYLVVSLRRPGSLVLTVHAGDLCDDLGTLIFRLIAFDPQSVRYGHHPRVSILGRGELPIPTLSYPTADVAQVSREDQTPPSDEESQPISRSASPLLPEPDQTVSGENYVYSALQSQEEALEESFGDVNPDGKGHKPHKLLSIKRERPSRRRSSASSVVSALGLGGAYND